MSQQVTLYFVQKDWLAHSVKVIEATAIEQKTRYKLTGSNSLGLRGFVHKEEAHLSKQDAIQWAIARRKVSLIATRNQVREREEELAQLEQLAEENK